MKRNDIPGLVINKIKGLKAIQQDLTKFITYYDISGRIIKILDEITDSHNFVRRKMLSKLNDINSNLIKRAKTGKCFTLGKHFSNSGPSKLEQQDVKIFTEFCIYATYKLYKELNEKLETNIEKEDSDKLTKKEHRDDKNKSIQEELILQVKTDLNDPAKYKIDKIIQQLETINDKKPTDLITKLNTLNTKLKNKSILSPEIYNFLNIILEQIKFLTKQRENINSKIEENNKAPDTTVIEKNIKKIQQDLLKKEKDSIENQILKKETDFIINLDKIISKIEKFDAISEEIKSSREHYEIIIKNIHEDNKIMLQHFTKISEAQEKLISAEEKLKTLMDTKPTEEEIENAKNEVEVAKRIIKNMKKEMKKEMEREMAAKRAAAAATKIQAVFRGRRSARDETGGEKRGEEGGEEGEKKSPEKKSPDTIDYEIEKFCNKYFEYFFKFAKINIYVIVNCSSILNDLAKALPLLIGLQLKKSIGTANQDELSKDKLSKDMKNQNLFGSGAFFNMYSLNIIKYIGFIYENSIPEIENLIGSVNDKYTRLKLLDNYLTSKYEIMVLGKEIHQKDNEKYEIDNPFIKNLLQDIFPDMGFSNGLIRKNIQNIDRAIEEHSDNIDLLQAELQEFLPIKFQDNGLLFANKQIQKIMIQDDDKSELKRIIKEKQDEKDKLTRLLAQAKAKAEAAPAAAPAAATP